MERLGLGEIRFFEQAEEHSGDFGLCLQAKVAHFDASLGVLIGTVQRQTRSHPHISIFPRLNRPFPFFYTYMELSLAAAQARFQFQSYIHKDTNKEITIVQDSDTEKTYVWKLIHCGTQETQKYIREREVQIHLNHPFILKPAFWVMEKDDCGVNFVLITPYTGSDLNKQLEMRVPEKLYWEESQLIRMLGETISALVYCQMQGIAHRDIKPQNIFVTSEGEIRLGDFGESKKTNIELQSICGSPFFSCPLKLQSYISDSPLLYNPFKSDVYSLGITFMQLAGLKSYKELRDQGILGELRGVYSLQLVNFIKGMIQPLESGRPDFLTLGKHFCNCWGEFMHLFPVDMVREECQVCSTYEAAEFCLCQFPLVFMCDVCLKRHIKAGEHETYSICFKDRFCNQKSVSGRWETSKLLKGAIESLYKGKSLIKEERKQQESAFGQLQTQLNDAKAAVEFRLSEAENCISLLIQELTEKLDTVQELAWEYIEKLKSIEQPYVRIRYLKGEEGMDVRYPVVVGRLEELKALDSRVLFPVISGKTISIYDWETVKGTIQLDSRVEIDDFTSFAMLSPITLAGYGGNQKPRQLFTVNLNHLQLKQCAEGLEDRQCAGLVSIESILYIFGGKSKRSAEKYDLESCKNTAISPMQVERHRFSPCEHMVKIYLPGRIIEIYDPSTLAYTYFASHHQISSFYFAYFHVNTLLICTETRVLSTPVAAPCVRDIGPFFPYEDWQLPPIQIGPRLYFFQGTKLEKWSFPGFIQ